MSTFAAECDHIVAFVENSGRLDQIMANIETLFLKLECGKRVYLMSSNSFSFLVPPGVNYVKVIIALIDFSSSRCLDLGCTCDLQLCLFNFSEFWLEDTQSMFPIRIVAERTVPGETRLPHRPDTDWRARRRREDRRAQVELGWQSGKNFITTEFQTKKGANDTFKENCLNCISFNRLLHLESS